MRRKIKKNDFFIIIGASMDTGNMGVNALFVSTVKCIKKAFPNVEILLFEGLRKPSNTEVQLSDRQIITIDRVGIRRNKTVWRKNHILRLLLTAILIRMIPQKKIREHFLLRNEYLGLIYSACGVADITGGDSFSDIYGLSRLFQGVLAKALIILTGQKLVMLPQTYGPFNSGIARLMAKWVLQRVGMIYSRDMESISVIQALMRDHRMKAEPKFSYDMAFVLDAIRPKNVQIFPKISPEKNKKNLIGVNINGLVYHGGFTSGNMFNLKADYSTLVKDIIREILKIKENTVLLIPHVFADPGHVESDIGANQNVYMNLCDEYPGRLFYIDGIYNQSEIKFIIGECKFFIGSRMHSCIASISQGIPTVPLAYSRKFYGVFESIGMGYAVSDLMISKNKEVIEHVMNIYKNRNSQCRDLKKNIPSIQNSIYQMIADTFSDL